jgi:hypothetical protein
MPQGCLKIAQPSDLSLNPKKKLRISKENGEKGKSLVLLSGKRETLDSSSKY